jgi:hypothetical protein
MAFAFAFAFANGMWSFEPPREDVMGMVLVRLRESGARRAGCRYHGWMHGVVERKDGGGSRVCT